ncbi:exodeoxyribonuclease III [Candidatus Pacearchaeota archaeon]|nr:exodeoxyribonuclease III [Candidatus Pacearchaeota archaeon]
MKIISWNVAGLRSCFSKGLLDFMKKEGADVYCFQEVKCQANQFPHELSGLKGYEAFHSFAQKKGYSGVSVYTKIKPINVISGIGNDLFDFEGRTITLEFGNFFLVNAYFPHSHRELKRLSFKLGFNKHFLKFCKKLEKIKPVVIASDFNVAHKEIDLRNPKQNLKNAGFTKEEREWFDLFLKEGFIDTFREFTQEPGHYTWWTYRNNARQRNIGWRVDYFIISTKLKSKLKKSTILKDVLGSDHAPISLEID